MQSDRVGTVTHTIMHAASCTPHLQDAYLPQRLLDKLMLMYNQIEMAQSLIPLCVPPLVPPTRRMPTCRSGCWTS